MSATPDLRGIGRIVIGLMLALFTTAGIAPTSAIAAPPARELRVMSYNMHAGIGDDGRLDLERTARVIETSGADVIGLQEVDRHWSARSDYVDQAQWLARRLGLHYAYGANLDRDPEPGRTERRQYGTAVLSRYPIQSATNHALTSIPYPERPTEQRGLLATRINVRGVKIDFYNTHLDHQRSEQRASQVTEILELTAGTQRPAILVGDLNAVPEAPEIRMLTDDAFRDVFAGTDAFTYPADAPNRRIDYVLTRGPRSFTDSTVIDTPASDHLPVVTTITDLRKIN